MPFPQAARSRAAVLEHPGLLRGAEARHRLPRVPRAPVAPVCASTACSASASPGWPLTDGGLEFPASSSRKLGTSLRAAGLCTTGHAYAPDPGLPLWQADPFVKTCTRRVIGATRRGRQARSPARRSPVHDREPGRSPEFGRPAGTAGQPGPLPRTSHFFGRAHK